MINLNWFHKINCMYNSAKVINSSSIVIQSREAKTKVFLKIKREIKHTNNL